MGKPIITVLDAVHCRANKYARPLIKDCFAYKASHYKRGAHGARELQVTEQFLITGHDGTAGTFLTGLLPRVVKAYPDIKVKGEAEFLEPEGKPFLNGITYRRDQKRALRAAKRKQRGKIIFPTGSGKTVIALGIMKMFPYRILWLCHTTDLLEQTMEEMHIYKFRNVHVLGGGHKINFRRLSRRSEVIVLSTIQSFSKLRPKDYSSFFDVTIVDEMHHVNEKGSQYVNVMENNLSPIRIGLTATEPTKKKEYITNEGIFGPVIATLEMEEGIDQGIIAKPKVNLVPVPYDVELNQMCKNRYKNFYEYGIVQNETRNKLIVRESIVSLAFNHITLIVVERTDHGKILKQLFKELHGLRVPFVYGDTSRSRRLNVKKKLGSGRLKIAICSKIWREGINIPALNQIINAQGMKEEKIVIQALGRGLRTTKDKTTILLTDFLDPYRYLAEHSISRIQTYKRQGWI